MCFLGSVGRKASCCSVWDFFLIVLSTLTTWNYLSFVQLNLNHTLKASQRSRTGELRADMHLTWAVVLGVHLPKNHATSTPHFCVGNTEMKVCTVNVKVQWNRDQKHFSQCLELCGTPYIRMMVIIQSACCGCLIEYFQSLLCEPSVERACPWGLWSVAWETLFLPSCTSSWALPTKCLGC